MPLNIQQLASARFQKTMNWDQRDIITYALATGHTQNGINNNNLKFVYENNLTVLPSFATVLARNAVPTIAELGGDYSKVVLASIEAKFEQPLPPSGSLVANTVVSAVNDKGPDKGAMVVLTTQLESENRLYASVTASTFARADGGCGQLGKAAVTPPRPDREADQQLLLTTRKDQAVLYRLLGDYNPLHIDPSTARKAGFEQPILHGLCTYGIAYRGLIESTHAKIKSLSARFSAPVYPGETLRIDIWNEQPAIHFELYAVERNIRVMSLGFATTG